MARSAIGRSREQRTETRGKLLDDDGWQRQRRKLVKRLLVCASQPDNADVLVDAQCIGQRRVCAITANSTLHDGWMDVFFLFGVCPKQTLHAHAPL